MFLRARLWTNSWQPPGVVAPFDNEAYYARAAVILPICKAGDYRQQLHIMHTAEHL